MNALSTLDRSFRGATDWLFDVLRVSKSAELRDSLHEVVTALALTGALFGAVGVLTRKLLPFSVVLSGSMEPTYYRNDLLIVSRRGTYKVGDVVVYDLSPLFRRLGLPTVLSHPIVHRVISSSHDASGKQELLTKGDNNRSTDIAFLPGPLRSIPADEQDVVLGRVVFRVAGVGRLSVLLEEAGGLPARIAAVVSLLATAWCAERYLSRLGK